MNTARQYKDFPRLVGYTAEKAAEQEYADCPRPPKNRTYIIEIDNCGDAGTGSVSCNSSCQTCAQGPAEQQGSRSHANGARTLLGRLGLRHFAARVPLALVREKPVKYLALDLRQLGRCSDLK